MIGHVLIRFIVALAFVALPAFSFAVPVTVLTVEGAIGPAAAGYIERGLARAEENGAQLVVLRMDTPGGLDTSMRSIIKDILASPVPVATYVSPSGARAASAGTYILYASHIAAMAPGTNLGAATPVQIGAPSTPGEPKKPAQEQDKAKDGKDADEQIPGEPTTEPMTQKQINDAAAYIRGLAQLRGRNAEWGEQAVRKAVSLSADEALELRVIDHVAADIPGLLKQIDGRQVNVLGQTKTLQTTDAQIVEYEPDWRARLLAVITNPSLALLLMTIGIYGLVLEFTNPGFGLAGVLGAICLLLALYALQLLPVNYAGLALILLGIAFMIAEAFLPSFGVLGLGGIAAFVTGAVILIDTEQPGFGIPIALIATVAVLSALLIAAVVGMAIKSRRLKVVGGAANLIGGIAEVVEATDGKGWAHIQGETWQVVSGVPLRRGQAVRVLQRNGLVLDVAPIDNDAKGE